MVPLFKIITALGIYDTELALISHHGDADVAYRGLLCCAAISTPSRTKSKKAAMMDRPEPPANASSAVAVPLAISGLGVGLCLLLHGGVE